MVSGELVTSQVTSLLRHDLGVHLIYRTVTELGLLVWCKYAQHEVCKLAGIRAGSSRTPDGKSAVWFHLLQ